MIKYPKFLQKGDTIGITALSDIANLDTIDLAINNLINKGFNIVETDNVRKRIESELVSSAPQERASQFVSLLKNSNINYILSARGGDFLMEILPYIYEYDEIFKDEKNVKWIQGYSDNSLLLYYITTRYNIATIDGGNLGIFAMKKWHKSIEDNFDLLTLKNNSYVQQSFDKYELTGFDEPGSEYNLTEEVKYISLTKKHSESFEGRLLGGCIDVLSLLLGTKFDNTTTFCKQFEKVIWHFDNYELSVADFYRMLWQMRQANWFSNASGFIFGRTWAPKEYSTFTYEHALQKALGDLGVPIIYDVDIGHVAPRFTIVNGSYATFEYNNGQGKLIQNFIQ